MNKQMTYYFSLLRRKAVWGALLAGAIIGIVGLGLVRFALSSHDETHYHANFAVYINGAKQTFKGPQYYQEVSACDEHASPLGRTHMHDENPGLVHVHDSVVTWSDFFTNLGWSFNNSAIFDGKTAYVDGHGGELSFMLNGKPVHAIANEIIGDQDRLLVSYSKAANAETLQQQYDTVGRDAKEADETADPATCQGPEHKDMWTQLRQAMLF